MLCFYLFWSCPLCNFSLLMCSFIYRCKCVSVQGKNWWKKLCLLPSKILSKLFPFLPHIREKMPFMKNHCKYKPNLRGAGKNIHHGEDEEQHPELETKRIACVVLLNFRFQTHHSKKSWSFLECVNWNSFLARWLFDPRFIKLMLVSR